MANRWAHVRGGWSGGDGVFSVAIAQRRVLWFFGDSIVARHDQPGYRFVRNAAVIEGPQGQLVTTDATREGRATIGFDELPSARWFWPGAAFSAGGRLWMFASEMRKKGEGPWGFAYVRSWLLRLAVDGTKVVELSRAPLRQDGIVWGAAVLKSGKWLYVFGVHDHPTFKHPHLARVLAADPTGPWDYWDGLAWAAEPAHRAHWLGSAASEFSVVRTRRGVALVSLNAHAHNTVEAYRARGPAGPWVALGEIFKPTTGHARFPYNALLHPMANGDFLVSWNIASSDPRAAVKLTPRALLPRFARLRAGCLGP